MKCDGCQLESERAEIFKKVPRSFRSDSLTLCPACFDKKDHRVNQVLICCFFGLGILSLPLTVNDSTHATGVLMLNMSVFQLLVLTSTVLHEMGHAVAGRLVGIRVFTIEIGKGRIVYEFLFAGLRWRIRCITFGGLTYSVPCTPDFFRLKRFLMVLGGPLANVIVLIISIKLLFLDQLIERTPFTGFVPMLLLALSNLLLLPFSLWPHTSKTAAGNLPNDGLNLWKTLWMNKAQIEQILPIRYLYEVEECRLQKNYPEASKWIEEGLLHFPAHILLKMSAVNILSHQRKYSEAVRAYARLIGRDKKHENLDSLLLNNIAYMYLLIGKPEFLPKADKCSRLALDRLPWVVYYKGTRGSVLVELGKYEEGLKLLHDAMRNHPEKHGQALNACYIGIAEARRGHLAESRNYFAVARKLDPACVLLEREAALN